MNKIMEPTLEVQLTLSELRAVVKSLGIGTDQLAKKTIRLGTGRRADEVSEELGLLVSALQEFQGTLLEGLKGDTE